MLAVVYGMGITGSDIENECPRKSGVRGFFQGDLTANLSILVSFHRAAQEMRGTSSETT